MKRLVAAALMPFFLWCAFAVRPDGSAARTESESKRLNRLFDAYFEDRTKLFPLEATAAGDHALDNRLTDYLADDHRAKQKAMYAEYLKSAARIDRVKLDDRDAVNLDVFKWDLGIRLEGLRYVDTPLGEAPCRLMPVNQFWSFPITFAQLGAGAGVHPFKTVKDYDNFIARVAGFQAWTNTAISHMRRGAAKGVVPPKVLMERVLGQLDELLVEDVTKSLFYEPVAHMPADFSPAEKARLTETCKRTISGRILPSYRKLRDFIRNEYLPKCRETSGIGAMPGGKETYLYLAKHWTTTELTPDEVFQIGLDEVKRIRAEMEKVRERVGFKGDLKAFFEYARTDKKFYPFRTENDVLDAYRAIETRIQASVPKYFGLLPKSRFEIRPTEKFRVATASEEYFSPAPDGSRPGIFYVPVIEAAKYHSLLMEALFLHEAIPGHHFQIALQVEQTDAPKFRRFTDYGAYTEGWALYTESLGGELGLYTDPYQYLGALTMDIHRAIRLVVDVGIHWKGWTRERAVEYSLENEPLEKGSITTEIERYMAVPGQALAYKIGQLKIRQLRREAETALGDRFDIREFHDQILKDGALPLGILETKIRTWIQKRSK